MKCENCKKANDFYGQKINCPKHRKPNAKGVYTVGCKKCDNILQSYNSEDGLCQYEI